MKAENVVTVTLSAKDVKCILKKYVAKEMGLTATSVDFEINERSTKFGDRDDVSYPVFKAAYVECKTNVKRK